MKWCHRYPIITFELQVLFGVFLAITTLTYDKNEPKYIKCILLYKTENSAVNRTTTENFIISHFPNNFCAIVSI